MVPFSGLVCQLEDAIAYGGVPVFKFLYFLSLLWFILTTEITEIAKI